MSAVARNLFFFKLRNTTTTCAGHVPLVSFWSLRSTDAAAPKGPAFCFFNYYYQKRTESIRRERTRGGRAAPPESRRRIGTEGRR